MAKQYGESTITKGELVIKVVVNKVDLPFFSIVSVRMLHSTAQEGAPISLYLQQILFKVLLKPIEEEVSQWNHSFCRTERERERERACCHHIQIRQ